MNDALHAIAAIVPFVVVAEHFIRQKIEENKHHQEAERLRYAMASTTRVYLNAQAHLASVCASAPQPITLAAYNLVEANKEYDAMLNGNVYKYVVPDLDEYGCIKR